ncbi:MAG: hypothetical protein HYX49_01485 [Chloroflexi bacterium]|nr:hypothetical protein [Chloroflexota bacterium]
MKTRLLVTVLVPVLVALFVPAAVLAKGNFSFIVIQGGGIDGELRSTDPALTDDFFAFADFFSAQTDQPAKPGLGYKVIRYYSYNGREIAFDYLHYYPETGYVYYDGIMGGWSEYDGKWYVANPNIKTSFENIFLKQTQSATPFIAAAALSLLFVLAFMFRQTSTH